VEIEKNEKKELVMTAAAANDNNNKNKMKGGRGMPASWPAHDSFNITLFK
jgi:hypothetical protein